MELTLTDANFEETIRNSPVPVLVNFYADWCGPCKLMAPVLEEIAKVFSGKLAVAKVDVDANQQTAVKYGVMSIPTVIIFDNKLNIYRQSTGFSGRDPLVKMVNEVVG